MDDELRLAMENFEAATEKMAAVMLNEIKQRDKRIAELEAALTSTIGKAIREKEELVGQLREANHNAAVAIGKDEAQQKTIERLRGALNRIRKCRLHNTDCCSREAKAALEGSEPPAFWVR